MRSSGAASGDSMLSMGLVWGLCVLLTLIGLAAITLLYIWLRRKWRKK
jgi:hypothetical protein